MPPAWPRRWPNCAPGALQATRAWTTAWRAAVAAWPRPSRQRWPVMIEHRSARHDLVWLQPGSASRATALPLPPLSADDAITRLAEWIDAGRPLVVARQPAHLAPGRLRLGLPLPASEGKLRLAFDVPRAAVLRGAPPPPLAAVPEHLPRRWHASLDALLASPAILAANPRVFGSAAMQAVTGIECVSEESDLDLLLAPANREAALAALAALAHI